jgi:hypothetical protein
MLALTVIGMVACGKKEEVKATGAASTDTIKVVDSTVKAVDTSAAKIIK